MTWWISLGDKVQSGPFDSHMEAVEWMADMIISTGGSEQEYIEAFQRGDFTVEAETRQ